MSDHTDQTPSPDVSLLLRAHAEQHWLSREVIPVLRQVEMRESLPEEQLGAAAAYLEVIWLEALKHARESDSARRELDELQSVDQRLCDKARRYHAAVRDLREVVAKRVTPHVGATSTNGSVQRHAQRLAL
jgi:hypothetical protein